MEYVGKMSPLRNPFTEMLRHQVMTRLSHPYVGGEHSSSELAAHRSYCRLVIVFSDGIFDWRLPEWSVEARSSKQHTSDFNFLMSSHQCGSASRRLSN
jgi:hypothetical protein